VLTVRKRTLRVVLLFSPRGTEEKKDTNAGPQSEGKGGGQRSALADVRRTQKNPQPKNQKENQRLSLKAGGGGPRTHSERNPEKKGIGPGRAGVSISGKDIAILLPAISQTIPLSTSFLTLSSVFSGRVEGKMLGGKAIKSMKGGKREGDDSPSQKNTANKKESLKLHVKKAGDGEGPQMFRHRESSTSSAPVGSYLLWMHGGRESLETEGRERKIVPSQPVVLLITKTDSWEEVTRRRRGRENQEVEEREGKGRR